MTMTKVIIRNCLACKKYQVTFYPDSQPGPLTKKKRQPCLLFQVIRVDYVGPIFYRSKTKKGLKAYIQLSSCSVSRAVYLELVANLTTSEFIRCLKRLIARRGRPKIIYSDNAKTFKAGAKLLQKINKDKKWHHHLNQEQITLKFNITKVPWWRVGGGESRVFNLLEDLS